MAEEQTYDIVHDMGGKPVRFRRPSQGQVEALIRIGFGLKRMGDQDDSGELLVKQLDRMGTLIESLIHPDDRDHIDQLYLAGDIEHTVLLRAVMGKLEAEAVASEDKAIAKARKSNPARVRRD